MKIQFNSISPYNQKNKNSSICFEKRGLPPFARKYNKSMTQALREISLELKGQDKLPEGIVLKSTVEPYKKINYSERSRFYR